MIKRLRPRHSPEALAEIYARPHDHRIYGYGHHLRVEHTIVLAEWLRKDMGLSTAADLSCGNGEIVGKSGPWWKSYLGDFAPGYPFTGPLEETINLIPPVDLFVCSETVEHLDDPWAALRQIREKAQYLLLSTPIGEDDLGNPEHYWGWDQEGVGSLLEETGWTSIARTDVLLPDTYSYQIWGCS